MIPREYRAQADWFRGRRGREWTATDANATKKSFGTAAGRPAEIPALVDQLVKRRVYDAGQGELLRASAHAEALESLAHDAAGLRAYWARVPDNDRLQSKVAAAAQVSLPSR